MTAHPSLLVAQRPEGKALPRTARALNTIAVVLMLATGMLFHAANAAEPTADQAQPAAATSQPKPDREAKDEEAKSGKGGQNANSPDAQAEKKPDDPCDPKKNLIDFELRRQLCAS